MILLSKDKGREILLPKMNRKVKFENYKAEIDDNDAPLLNSLKQVKGWNIFFGEIDKINMTIAEPYFEWFNAVKQGLIETKTKDLESQLEEAKRQGFIPGDVAKNATPQPKKKGRGRPKKIEIEPEEEEL